MKIKGIVTKISPNYPYEVEIGNGKFTSHFKFTVGQRVMLDFPGGVFTSPWPYGFIICEPNGVSLYNVTEADFKLMSGDSISRHCCRFPIFIQDVILTGKPKRWTQVESFYEYYYTAEYNADTKILSTNYAMAT
jgi:hypothetical protein